MKGKLLALLIALMAPAFAHRLDEYLQATIISVEPAHVRLSMRLIPGVAVANTVLPEIDPNGGGAISEVEGRAYVERVVRELLLSVDGHRLSPRIASAAFPSIEEMREGTGEIHIELTAELPDGGQNRKLAFENHHEPGISAYLVNCLAPQDSRIHIVAQNRNRNQSFYELEYVEGNGPLPEAPGRFESLLGAASMFRLGMRHIAEGTDHLLFLLVLLIPSPLIALGSRRAGRAGLRRSFMRILKVVTAFTIGHSITLALAALGFVTVPSRPIEVLIAVSIFVSAIHAFRPLFPGREPVIAAFFGLIHGLAFAATLGQLGLDRWTRLANIFAFNLGIETMQLAVVAAVMPSLLLLSSTRVYSGFRIGGAVFAGIASLGWIVERLFNVAGPVDFVIDALAHRGVWLATGLFVISAFCWWRNIRSFAVTAR